MIKKIICGIYKIQNKINNKIYIGSSKNIFQRWDQHKSSLKANSHHSVKLQRAWNKYGEDNFVFEIIEECDKDRRLYIEQYFIDKYNTYFEGYNCKDKTKDIFTELDYEKQKYFAEYSKYILEFTDNYNLVFTDKNTLSRIENYIYKDNENVWYKDICAFVHNVLKFEFDVCLILNNKKENKNGFIDFEISRNSLDFKIISEEYNCIILFNYELSTRQILLQFSYDYIGYSNNIFDNRMNYNNGITNKLLGMLFHMEDNEIKVDVLNKRYAEAFDKLFSIGVVEFYKGCFGYNEKFLNFLLDNLDL